MAVCLHLLVSVSGLMHRTLVIGNIFVILFSCSNYFCCITCFTFDCVQLLFPVLHFYVVLDVFRFLWTFCVTCVMSLGTDWATGTAWRTRETWLWRASWSSWPTWLTGQYCCHWSSLRPNFKPKRMLCLHCKIWLFCVFQKFIRIAL